MISIPSQKPFRGMQLNRNHPLAKGLVGCWVMNEATGNKVFDLSGNGNDGNIIGADWVANGLDFVAADSDYVSASVSSGWLSYPHTIISLFKTPSSGTQRIVTIANVTSDTIYFALDANVGNDFTYWFRAASGNLIYTAETPAADTVYMMVGVSSAKNNHELYIDGRYKDMSTVNADPLAVDTIGFGVLIRLNPIYSDGEIYSTYIYNRALSPTEIAWLNREPYAMFQREISPGILYYEAAAGGANPHWYYEMLKRRNR